MVYKIKFAKKKKKLWFLKNFSYFPQLIFNFNNHVILKKLSLNQFLKKSILIFI